MAFAKQSQMLNVGDLLRGTRENLTINPLLIRSQRMSLVLLGVDRAFCSFSISRSGSNSPFFSNPNSYITHWVRGEEGSYHGTLNKISSINLSYISDILGKILA